MRRLALVALTALAWAAGARADDAASHGNPLQAVPLSALAATRERPLFSASRRAPAAPVAIAPQAPPPPPPPPSAGAPEAPPFQLMGTILGGEAHVALLLNRSTNEVTQLREGESALGWKARKVLARSILLQHGADNATLELPKSTDAVEANAASPPDASGAPIEAPGPAVAAAPAADPVTAPRPPRRRLQR